MDISNFSYFSSSMQENIGIAKIGYIFYIFTFFISYWIDSVTSFRYEWKSMQNNTIEQCVKIYAWHNIYIPQWIKFNISWLFLFFNFWNIKTVVRIYRSTSNEIYLLCSNHITTDQQKNQFTNISEYLIIILHQPQHVVIVYKLHLLYNKI